MEFECCETRFLVSHGWAPSGRAAITPSPPLKWRRGPGRGGFLVVPLSPRSSPHSCVAGRGCQCNTQIFVVAATIRVIVLQMHTDDDGKISGHCPLVRNDAAKKPLMKTNRHEWKRRHRSPERVGWQPARVGRRDACATGFGGTVGSSSVDKRHQAGKQLVSARLY